MEAVERSPARTDALRALRVEPANLATGAVAALLIVYLGLNNGGYGVVERSEVGIAVWWTVLVGTVVGALPLAGGTRVGRALFILLAAFAAWTALSLSWTESDERTTLELARVVSYLGVFALALGVQGGERWRPLLHGVTAGLALLCGLAVLSRLEPGWFPDRVTGIYLPGIEIERRLAYPVNYSSGLGALTAMTLPLLLAATSSARTLIAQAVAAAALPVVVLTLWLTTSSLSIPAALLALVVFFVLAPDRLPKLATLTLAGIGSVILIAAVEHRDALDRGLPTPQALTEGDEMKLIVIAVCLGVALAQTGIGLAVRYGTRPRWMEFSREQVSVVGGVAVVAVLIVLATAGLTGGISDKWSEFKGENPTGEGPAGQSRSSQIFSFSSSGRYEFWRSAVAANKTDPLKGIGPGTFEFWYAREGENPGFIRDAHSLYLETLAELGIVGLVLIGGFMIAVLGIGTARVLRAPPDLRVTIAAATAGCAAFAAAAAFDWVWELGVLPVAFLALAAIVIAAGREPHRLSRRAPRWRHYVAPAVATGLSLTAIVAIALPLAGDAALRESRDAARAGQLVQALADARDAAAIQSYAATPYLQEAVIEEERGDLAAALAAARLAAQKEPTNWRTWFVLSRLEARNGNARAAVDAYREAQALNPRSPLFLQ